MASSSSSISTGGVPPGFRFHPTDEELLLYYLTKKVSLEKFDLDVIREVDLNKVEPWELQERCRIGATPQNEWYFFSHKDRKYPTGSRTNRATSAGFWKATGRDKCIRTSYKKIGMRKTLVFYRGRAPHGQKTDWIMHEYRLKETDDDQGGGREDGWVICRVFKKKCFFKTGSNEGSSSHGVAADTITHMNATATSTGFDQSRSLYLHHHHNQQQQYNNPIHAQPAQNLYRPELALHYSHNDHLIPSNINPYRSQQIQVQDLLPNHRPPSAGYDFSVLPGGDGGSAGMVDGRDMNMNTNEWAMMDDNQMSQAAAVQQQQRGGEMDLWGYGKD